MCKKESFQTKATIQDWVYISASSFKPLFLYMANESWYTSQQQTNYISKFNYCFEKSNFKALMINTYFNIDKFHKISLKYQN